jgi:hypothetical protein
VLSLAALARETTLLVPLGLALGTWIDSRSKRGAWLILPAAVLAVWELQLGLRWGGLPFQQATALALPFTGLARFLSEYLPPERPVELWHLVGLAYLAGLIASTAYSVRWAAGSRGLVVAWASYVALATALSWNVWIEDISFLRATIELQILSVALLIHSHAPSWALRLVGTATGVLWLHHAFVRIDHL